ncbi:hypothetical protein DES38_10139 [Streptohalobacillus salinus]|uniref:YdhG-like domain-containing protein n=1 Tax=Streptohalobacillus salinus TaxID=621096 RepID=A0A2V3WHE0_9BACI|nr:DUF1801 domain-containing protein [Streptohalobacillus salinus]PXW92961.1 hypothetical protein DES38_10139 [Streptohalobacillus salinus]
METIADFLATIEDEAKRERLVYLFDHIKTTFPTLESTIKWNQPMFIDHGTFIIAFSVSKQHMAIAPEAVTINAFSNQIQEAGYQAAKEIVRVKWKEPLDLQLIDAMIRYNIAEKKDTTSFWRK